MDRNSKFIMECDFYGELLTDRQREVVELYHGDNLTLAEIADEFGISRQGVHDTLKNAETALTEYEEKLGLVDKFRFTEKSMADIEEIAGNVIRDRQDDKELVLVMRKVLESIDKLDEYWLGEAKPVPGKR